MPNQGTADTEAGCHDDLIDGYALRVKLLAQETKDHLDPSCIRGYAELLGILEHCAEQVRMEWAHELWREGISPKKIDRLIGQKKHKLKIIFRLNRFLVAKKEG